MAHVPGRALMTTAALQSDLAELRSRGVVGGGIVHELASRGIETGAARGAARAGSVAIAKSAKSQSRQTPGTSYGGDRGVGDVIIDIGGAIIDRLLPPGGGGRNGALKPTGITVDSQGRCIPPFRRDQFGNCSVFAGKQKGPDDVSTGGTDMVVFSDAVTGAFGMPAIRPVNIPQNHLTCPKGMVLGEDDLCYPRQVLRRDSRFRKWKPGTRPVLTGGEVRAIATARRAITRGRERMSSLGVTVKKK